MLSFMTKRDQIKAALDTGDYKLAFGIASKFPSLGRLRSPILDGHLAVTRPEFLKQIKKNPEMLKTLGLVALRQLLVVHV